MDHVKQERTAELSTHGFTTVAKLKAKLKKLGIKLSKKSKLKAELIHILVEHEFVTASNGSIKWTNAFESDNGSDDEHSCTYDPCGDRVFDPCDECGFEGGACECHDCQWCGGRKTHMDDYDGGNNSDNEECSEDCRGANPVLTEADVDMIMNKARNGKGENAWEQFEKWQRLDLDDFFENILDLGEEWKEWDEFQYWGSSSISYEEIQEDLKLVLYERMKKEASERLGSMFYAIFILKKFARAWIVLQKDTHKI